MFFAPNVIAAKFRKADRKRLLLNTFITACTLVTGIGMFSGFLGLGGALGLGQLLAAACFTLLVAAALTYSVHGFFRAEDWQGRTGWGVLWLLCVSVSVALSYGLYFGIFSGEAHGKREVIAESDKLVDTLSGFSNAYGQLSATATDVANYSDEVGRIERETGGTCPGSTSPNNGPRTRKREADAAATAVYAPHFEKRHTALAAALLSARTARDGYNRQNHQKTMAALQNAYLVARDASADSRITNWQTMVRSRIEEGTGAMTDPLTGTSFTCLDPVLQAKLQSAASVVLPKLPQRIDALEAPGQAKGVKRGIALVTGETGFDARYDALPLLFGVLVDALLAGFIRAKMNLEPTDPNSPDSSRRSQASSTVLNFRRQLSAAPTLGTTGLRLDTALKGEHWQWLDVLDRWSIRMGKKMVIMVPADSSAHTDARALRLIVALLGTKKVLFTKQLTFERLPLRFQTMLADRALDNKAIQLFYAPAALIAELDIDWLRSQMGGSNDVGGSAGHRSWPDAA
jgi:hypothetical protein